MIFAKKINSDIAYHSVVFNGLNWDDKDYRCEVRY